MLQGIQSFPDNVKLMLQEEQIFEDPQFAQSGILQRVQALLSKVKFASHKEQLLSELQSAQLGMLHSRQVLFDRLYPDWQFVQLLIG